MEAEAFSPSPRAEETDRGCGDEVDLQPDRSLTAPFLSISSETKKFRLDNEDGVASVKSLLSVHSRFFRIHCLPAIYSNVVLIFASPESLKNDGMLSFIIGWYSMCLVATCYVAAHGCTKKTATIRKNRSERIERFVENTRTALDNQSREDAVDALEHLARIGQWLGYLGVDADFADLELAVLREPSLRAEIDQERLRRRRYSVRIFVSSQVTWLFWHYILTPFFCITVFPGYDRRLCIFWYLLLILGLVFELRRKKETEALVDSLSAELLGLA